MASVSLTAPTMPPSAIAVRIGDPRCRFFVARYKYGKVLQRHHSKRQFNMCTVAASRTTGSVMWNVYGRLDRPELTSSGASHHEAPAGNQFKSGGAAWTNAALSSVAAVGSCCPAVLLPISLCLGHPWSAEAQVASNGPVSTLSGMARVIDGDTLEVEKERVRLFGVDAPETAQLCTDKKGASYGCGKEATEALRSKIGNKPVKCLVRNRDQYQRAVAICQVGPDDVAKWMVQQGEAVAYREYSSAYVEDEENARKASRGIWSSTFEAPKDWRKQRKASSASAGNAGTSSTTNNTSQPSLARQNQNQGFHPDGCDIKGNISASGERIYHVPKGQYYSATNINSASGERWFCSEREAESAGWRPSSK